MESKIALLSNVNMNFVVRMLQKEAAVYEPEGYGNELGLLMNPASSYHTFAPDYTFLVMDLMELIEHELDMTSAEEKIAGWFGMLENALNEQGIYYVSDAYLWGVETAVVQDVSRKQMLEELWLKHLQKLCEAHANVRIFPYRHMIESLGEERAFSLKMWYMGRILLGNDTQKLLCEMILKFAEREKRTSKKVLLLDLDNTLWGGLAGEAEHTPIVLSEEHGGLAYKNLQRVILQMQKQGVLLGIVSKNNEEDALEMIRKHPHMVLREECFVAKRINWQPKHENILEIAKELNLGTDSFVFWDDNPTERELVKEMLPEVAVPDFPDKPEELAPAMAEIYEEYFAKAHLTKEDLAKTGQYAANAKRNDLQKNAASFEDYLKQLQIVITRVNPREHVDRLVQMANKTNQFNLTTRRYDVQQMQQILQDDYKQVYLYNVEDKFGDNGLVAMAIVDLPVSPGTTAAPTENATATSTDHPAAAPTEHIRTVPLIEEFVMSCRVMGKQIEHAVIADIEQDLRQAGFTELHGLYLPTAKNKPVAGLYQDLGYELVSQLADGGCEYRIRMEAQPRRTFQGKMLHRYDTEWKH